MSLASPVAQKRVTTSILPFACGSVAGLCATLASVFEGTPSSVVAAILFGAAGFVAITRLDPLAKTLYILIVSANIIVACSIHAVYTIKYDLPYYGGGSDDLTYEEDAQIAADLLPLSDYTSIRGKVVSPIHNSVGYVYVVSVLWRIGESFGGFSTLIPKYLNAAALGLISVLILQIGRRSQLPQRYALNAALLTGLLPIMTFVAAHTFRDVLMSLMCLWLVERWDHTLTQRGSTTTAGPWCWALALAYPMWEMRQMMIVGILFLCLLCELTFASRKYGWLSAGTVLRFASLLFVGLAGLHRALTQWAMERATHYSDIYTDYLLDSNTGLSVAAVGGWGPLNILLRTVYGFLIPLPFLGSRFEEQFQGVGTLVHYYFLPYLALGVCVALGRREILHVIFSFLIFYSMMLVTFTFRHVVIYLPYGVLIAGYGYQHCSGSRRLVFLGTVLAGLTLALSYIALKGSG